METGADNRGWIALHRKLQDNSLWREPRVFSRAEAWIDILMEARHASEPAQVLIGLHVVECGRGQCIKSLDTWARRWRWSKSKVHRFLSLIAECKMVEVESVTKTTRITVCNYDRYNQQRNDAGTHAERTRNARGTHAEPNNNEDNGNKGIMREVGGGDAHPPSGNSANGSANSSAIPAPARPGRIPTPADAAAVKAHAHSIGRVCSDEQAEAFFCHYQSTGWVDGNGLAVHDWRAKLVKWLVKDKSDANKPGPSILNPKRHTKW